MERQKFNMKNKTKLPRLLMLYIVTGFTIGIIVYIVTAWLIYSELFDKTTLIITYSLMVILIISIVLFLVKLFTRKLVQEQLNTDELKKFKDFIYSLHYISTEEEAYEILYDYVRKILNISQTTLFYNINGQSEEDQWKKLTNAKIPLCNAIKDNCPLMKHSNDCIIKSIEKDIACSCQDSIYKKGSYICLPVLNTGYVQSILQFYSKTEGVFSTSNIVKIKSYIEFAIPVLNSKKAFNVLNKKASTDRLTKLYNRDFLDPYLDNQIEIAKRTNNQLSIVLLDIDYFKTINDKLGHSAGDYVLAVFSGVIKKCIRKSDLAARYGGDEFIIVLPASSSEAAKYIAERIRQDLDETIFLPYDGEEMPPVKCSLGIASYPIHSDNKDDLIKCADVALYKAKQLGRNNSFVYSK